MRLCQARLEDLSRLHAGIKLPMVILLCTLRRLWDSSWPLQIASDSVDVQKVFGASVTVATGVRCPVLCCHHDPLQSGRQVYLWALPPGHPRDK